MKKRVLSIFLVFVMLLGMSPVYALETGDETKGEILSFDIEETEITASLGTIPEELGLPETITATVNEPVTVMTGGEDGQTIVSTYMEERETELSVTWTSEDYALAYEGTYTFTARAEGYTLADGVAWPTATVTLKHRLAHGTAFLLSDPEAADNSEYMDAPENTDIPETADIPANADEGVMKVADGAASVTTNGTTTPYNSLQAALDAAEETSTVTLLADITEAVTISKPLAVLDWAGHTLSGTLTVNAELGVLKNTVKGVQNFQTGGVSTSANPAVAVVYGSIGDIQGGRYVTTDSGHAALAVGWNQSGSVAQISGGWFTGIYAVYYETSTAHTTQITGGIFDAGKTGTIGGNRSPNLTGGYFGSTSIGTATGTLTTTTATLPTGYGGITGNTTPYYTVINTGAVYMASWGDDANDGTRANPVASVYTAIGKVDEGGTIYVMDDVTLAKGDTAVTKSFTLTTDPQAGGVATVTGTGKKSFLVISSGTTVTVENLILDGDGSNYNGTDTNAFLIVGPVDGSSAGNLILGDGAAIRNVKTRFGAVWTGANESNIVEIREGAVISGNTNNGTSTSTGTNAGLGGAITLRGGTVTMSGGKITGNSAANGGGVAVINGTFNMTGGQISGNSASWGGGVEIRGGTFNMGSAAKISSNTTSGTTWDGGGIRVIGGTADLAGEISGNTAHDGAGVLVRWDSSTNVAPNARATATISGRVTGNIATYGAGVYVENGDLTLNSATIVGNKSANYGAGAFLHSNQADASITLTGRVTILDNISYYISAPEENNLLLFSGTNAKMVKLDNLDTRSQIGVTHLNTNTWNNVEGNFAYGLETVADVPEAVVNCFTSDDEEFHVEASGLIVNGNNYSRGLALVRNTDTGYYVSSSGSDSNDGTRAKPYKTLNKALTEAKGKEETVIYVMDNIMETGSENFHLQCDNLIITTDPETLAASGPATVTLLENTSYIQAGRQVTIPGTTTLRDIVFDGTERDQTAAGPFDILLGTLILDEGAVLQNFTSTGPTVSTQDMTANSYTQTIELREGAAIQNNTNTEANGLGGGVYVSPSATLTMTGGAISGNTALMGGGVYLADGAAFKMNGGELADNKGTSTTGFQGGAAVFMAGGTFTMGEEASITKNEAAASAQGGVVHINGGTAELRGTIADNTSAADAGGVMVVGADTKVTITGRITDNTGTVGSAVYVYSGSVTLDGATITGNKTTSDNRTGAVYFFSGTTVVLKGDTVITSNTDYEGKAHNLCPRNAGVLATLDSAGLTDGANIGVRFYEGRTGNFATGEAAVVTASRKYFHADLTGCGVADDGNGTLSLVDVGNYYVKSDGDDNAAGTVTAPFKTLNKAVEMAQNGSAIYLMDEVPITAQVTITKDVTITGTYTDAQNNTVIGGSLKRANTSGGALAIIISGGATVNMTDLTYDGNNTALTDAESAIHVSASTLNMTNVILQNHHCRGTWDASTDKGVLQLKDGATLNVTGGKIINNTEAQTSWGIIAGHGDQQGNKVTLDGVTMTGNKQTSTGALITNISDLTLKNVTITGNSTYNGVVNSSDAKLTLIGSNNISGNLGGTNRDVTMNLNISSSKPAITVESVVIGKVGVTQDTAAKGVAFAAAGSDADAKAGAMAFFHDGGTLSPASSGENLIWDAGTTVARVKSSSQEYATLKEAVEAAGQEDTIEILRDISQSEGVTIDGKKLRLTSADGNSYMIRRDISVTGSVTMLTVTNGGDLTIDHLTLDGGKELGRSGYTYTLVGVTRRSNATLNEGAILQNSIGDPSQYGKPALSLDRNSTATMNDGAIIRWNESAYGGGVSIYYETTDYSGPNTFTMNGGEIYGNISLGRNSGQVYGTIYNASVFEMNGGSIHDNTGDVSNGYADTLGVGVYTWYNAVTKLSGDAVIENNYNVDADGTRTLSNIYLYQANGTSPEGTIELTGDFTGRATVLQAESIENANASGGKFGTAVQNFAGAGNIVNEKNPGLHGIVSGTDLIWAVSDYYVSSTGDDTTGNGTEASPYKTLNKALSMAQSGSTIHIMDQVTEPSWTNISGKDITITGTNGNGVPYSNARLVCGGNMLYNNVYGMLRISSMTLYIDHLILDGGGYNTRAFRMWDSGVLKLGEGTVITNWGSASNPDSGSFGAIYANGTVETSGHVVISGNRSGGMLLNKVGKLVLSGQPEIHSNVNTAGQPSNVQMNNREAPQLTVNGTLANGSAIGITDPLAAPGVIFAVNDSNTMAQANLDKFFADNGQDIAINDEVNLVWGGAVARVVHTDGTATNYSSLQLAVNAATTGETVELLTNTTETVTVTTSFDALDWMGHTLNGSLSVGTQDGTKPGAVGVIRNTVSGAQNYVTGGVMGRTYIYPDSAVNEIAGGRYQSDSNEALTIFRSGSLGQISGGWFTGGNLAVCWNNSGVTSDEATGGTVIMGGVFDKGTTGTTTMGYYSENVTNPIVLLGGFYENTLFTYGGQKLNYTGTLSTTTVSVVGQGGITKADVTKDEVEVKYYPVTDNDVARTSNDGGTNWDYFDTLAGAVNAVTAASGAYVELLKDVTLTEGIAVASKTFTLRSDSRVNSTYTVKRGGTVAAPMQQNLFELQDGSNVTVEELVIDGGAVWTGVTDATLGRGTVNSGLSAGTGYLFYVNGGTLKLTGGAMLRNNERNSSTYTNAADGQDRGSAVSVQNGGSLTMADGAVIRDCATLGTVADGAAVSVWDSNNGANTFTMTGGLISGNFGGRWGAVRIGQASSFIMTGGQIASNKSGTGTDARAGVAVVGTGTITVSGDARITGNIQNNGAQCNLYLADKTNLVTLTGNFTGSIGISQGFTGGNLEGARFGTTGNVAYTGVGNFFSDVNDELFGAMSGNTLIWGTSVARTSNDGGRTWTEFTTLADAINAADSDPDTVTYVELLKDITQDRIIDIKGGRSFTLRSNSDESATYTITRAAAFNTHAMFSMTESVNVQVENLVLDGNKQNVTNPNWACYTFHLPNNANSTLTLGDGAILQNNRALWTGTGNYGAGAVMIWATNTLNIEEGAIIRWNEADYGSAVSLYNGGTAYMTGGQIYGNFADRGTGSAGDNRGSSGAVNVFGAGRFVMTGGSITGNGAKTSATQMTTGGICVTSVNNDGGLEIGGSATVSGNYITTNRNISSGQYTTGTAANVRLDDDVKLRLISNFTGSVGVSDWNKATAGDNNTGDQFGVADSAYTGVGNFVNDVNGALMGTMADAEDSSGKILKWAEGAVARTSNDGGKTWTEYATLQEAVDAVDSDPKTVSYVEPLRNISVSAAITTSKTFTLRSGTRDGDGRYSLSRTTGYGGALLDISGTQGNVTMTDIVVDGDRVQHTGGTTYMVRVSGGATLTLSKDAILQNNLTTSGSYTTGAAYAQNDSTINVEEGAVIRWNEAQYGSALTTQGGTINMTGGEIYGNYANRNSTKNQGAGALTAWGGGIINMTGGSITGNGAYQTGAGIVYDDGTVNIGGTAVVTENYITTDKTPTLNGGRYTSGTEANVRVSPTSVGTNTLNLTGDFTGKVGVTQNSNSAYQNTYVENANQAGTQFGFNANGYSGAKNFVNDVSGLLGTTEDGKLVWASNAVARTSNDGGQTWKEFETLAAAIDEADSDPNTETHVELLRDLDATEQITINTSKTFTLRSGTRPEDETYTLTRAATGFTSGVMFSLTGGANVTVENLILDGNKTVLGTTAGDSCYFFYVAGSSTLTLNSGAVLQNNRANWSKAINSGGIQVTGGCTLNINDGAVIRWNENQYGSAVSINGGTVNMTGGEIYGNYAIARSGNRAGSGAIDVWGANGIFNMSGGSITGNGAATNAKGAAGGVWVQEGTFQVSGAALVTGNYVCENQSITGTSETDRYTAGTAVANVLLNTGTLVTQTGDFTGTMGVSSVTLDNNTEGMQFGTMKDNGDFTGAANFTNDRNPALIGTVDTAEDGTGKILKWAELTDTVARVNNLNGGADWTEYTTLAAAVAAVEDSQIVELLRDVVETQTITSTKTFTLRSSTKEEDTGKTYTVERGAAMTLFSLTGNVTMENIVLDGGAVYGEGTQWWKSVSGVSGGAVMVVVSNGSLTLDDGAVLRNAARPGGATYGAALSVNNSTVTLLEGSVIEKNMVATHSPAIRAMGASRVNIQGGTVQNNACSASQGIIQLEGTSGLDMTSGTITGNYGQWYGGTILAAGTNEINLSGGSITGNSGGTRGPAGVSLNATSSLTLTGSIEIYNNTNTAGVQSNVWLRGENVLTVSGTLTGTVGITDAWTGAQNVPGEVFGLGINAAGLEGLKNDSNPALYAVLEGGNVKWANEQVAKMMGGRKNGTTYPTLAAAIADYDTDAYYILMIADSTEEPITVDRDVYVDLAGFTVTADVRVSSGKTFYGFDTTTNGYDSANGYGKIIGVVSGSGKMAAVTETNKNQTSEAMRYLKVTETEDGVTATSFHRFNMKLGTVVFRPSAAGIYFKSEFYGDQQVKAAILADEDLTYGLFLGATASTVPGISNAAAHDPANFQTGLVGNKHQGSMITDIVVEGAADNADRSNTPIYVSTYFNFEDAGVVADAMRSVTLNRVVELAAQQYGVLDDSQKRAFQEFMKKFGDLYPNVKLPEEDEDEA